MRHNDRLQVHQVAQHQYEAPVWEPDSATNKCRVCGQTFSVIKRKVLGDEICTIVVTELDSELPIVWHHCYPSSIIAELAVRLFAVAARCIVSY